MKTKWEGCRHCEVINVWVLFAESLRRSGRVQPSRDGSRLSLPVSCFQTQLENFLPCRSDYLPGSLMCPLCRASECPDCFHPTKNKQVKL